MKFVLPFITLALACCSTAVWAESTPSILVGNSVTTPGKGELPRIPIREAALTDLVSLPRTLPVKTDLVYFQCRVQDKVIALTFDDGPHATNTPRLLDILKERGIKATFFLVGRSAATWPEIVKRTVDEGHEIANHTWSHPELNRMSTAGVINQLQKAHDAIKKAGGVDPILYRPPFGATLLHQRIAIHKHFQYPTINWDVDTLDWKSPRSAAKVHDEIIKLTKPGSIILCHDTHPETIDAMPETLDELAALGYHFVTVTQLINLEARTAANQATDGNPVTTATPQSAPVKSKPASATPAKAGLEPQSGSGATAARRPPASGLPSAPSRLPAGAS